MDGAHQVGVEGLSPYGIMNFVIVPISNAVVRGPAIDLWESWFWFAPTSLSDSVRMNSNNLLDHHS